MSKLLACAAAAVMAVAGGPALALPFFFTTGSPDGLMASASRPDTPTQFEIESADDFPLLHATRITGATFTGLIPANATVANMVVEIYRIFPLDSDVSRTSGPPTFSTPNVPTRVNSPSDVALESRDLAAGDFAVSTVVQAPTFTASNSVQPGGIHPLPNPTTGGNGPVTGAEVTFALSFSNPIDLAAGHYFIVPQVTLDSGDFLWLSAPKPITPPATPFPLGVADLQTWIRDVTIEPDWLRIGRDVVGGTTPPAFNASFSLTGVVPEPGTLGLVAAALAVLLAVSRARAAAR